MDDKILRKNFEASLTELPSLGMDVHSLVEDFRRYYSHTLGRDRHSRSSHYAYHALVLSLRDRLLERWKNTRYAYESTDAPHAYYLSLEFLMGRALGNAALNLDLDEETELTVSCLGMELDDLANCEHDAGLGNGGLGRLASCFLDSCATLQLPVTGYGLRYEYGMFRQTISAGAQIEEPDHWLREGNPWELERPEYTQRIRFGGHIEWLRENGGVHNRAGSKPATYWRCPMMFPSRAIAMALSTPCACGRPARPTNSTSVNSTPGSIPNR